MSNQGLRIRACHGGFVLVGRAGRSKVHQVVKTRQAAEAIRARLKAGQSLAASLRPQPVPRHAQPGWEARGGHARAQSMSPEARRASASTAARARWDAYRKLHPRTCAYCDQPMIAECDGVAFDCGVPLCEQHAIGQDGEPAARAGMHYCEKHRAEANLPNQPVPQEPQS